jgi:hypothetical protein
MPSIYTNAFKADKKHGIAPWSMLERRRDLQSIITMETLMNTTRVDRCGSAIRGNTWSRWTGSTRLLAFFRRPDWARGSLLLGWVQSLPTCQFKISPEYPNVCGKILSAEGGARCRCRRRRRTTVWSIEHCFSRRTHGSLDAFHSAIAYQLVSQILNLDTM